MTDDSFAVEDHVPHGDEVAGDASLTGFLEQGTR
jgi:hypothetical protein